MTPLPLCIFGTRTFDCWPLFAVFVDEFLARVQNEHRLYFLVGTPPPPRPMGTWKGADLMGLRYAIERGHRFIVVPAEWQVHGRKAGPLRNQIMCDHAQRFICVWDQKSRGTHDMRGRVERKAKKLGVPTGTIQRDLFYHVEEPAITKQGVLL